MLVTPDKSYPETIPGMTLPLFEFYCDPTRKIPLTRGKFAIVDAEDYDRFAGHSWQAQWNPYSKTFYAVSHYQGENGQSKVHHLHREVLGVTDPRLDVDHKDHDGLNCRKQNLRPATRSQNAANGRIRRTNTTGYKGVYHPAWRSTKWQASICCQYKITYIGCYVTKEEAARAYDRKAIELFGEFAHTNFPRSDYPDLL